MRIVLYNVAYNNLRHGFKVVSHELFLLNILSANKAD